MILTTEAAYFRKKGAVAVDMAEWIVADDSPHAERCSMRFRATDHLERMLACAKDLSEEDIADVTRKMADL